ncbi:MAG: hypothetical protein IT444_07445 [Phycisphaeraceae bacterium]|nr:hypothetical protein [Phycisphaeraceae bacterium]
MSDAKVEPSLTAKPAHHAGLTFSVARNLDEVTAAWRMVYMAYRRSGLIEPNAYRIHTAPQAVGPHAAVISAQIGEVTVSTLTAFADGPVGLPLDRVYEAELKAFRAEGRSLMEVGLFADRRIELHRTAESLFELMRYAFYYGLRTKVTDFVIGVHPRHARFYTRAFGFEAIGGTRTYPAVNHRPVVLLRGDLDAKLKLTPLHPALDYFVNNPVPTTLFDERFSFAASALGGSIIEQFLAAQARDYDERAKSA